jgi:tubulin polyglutamylase TTLL9
MYCSRPDVHLTNVAVQKTNSKYDPNSGGKWNIRNLKLYLMHKCVSLVVVISIFFILHCIHLNCMSCDRYGVERVNTLFMEILMIIIRSLQSVQKVMINDKHCFELYGYDILIDDQLKPWLLEVNASPSLTANTQDDWALKVGMLDDAMSLIDLEGRLVGDEEQVGGFDLVYSKNGLVKFDPSCLFTTYLGAQNHRVKNLRKLAKNFKKRQQTTGATAAEADSGPSQ